MPMADVDTYGTHPLYVMSIASRRDEHILQEFLFCGGKEICKAVGNLCGRYVQYGEGLGHR
jgi:hypothetical protein